MRILGLACVVLVAAGCVSAPKLAYHTLDVGTAPSTGDAAVNVVVDQIRVAEPLRRNDILIKKSPTEIEYYATHQWAASLSELVAQKLSAAFGPRNPEKDTILLYGTLLAFEQIDTPEGPKVHVRLDVQFRAEGAGRYEEPALEAVYENPLRLEQPVAAPNASIDETVRAVVLALSDRIGLLAEQIRMDAVRAHELAMKAEASNPDS